MGRKHVYASGQERKGDETTPALAVRSLALQSYSSRRSSTVPRGGMTWQERGDVAWEASKDGGGCNVLRGRAGDGRDRVPPGEHGVFLWPLSTQQLTRQCSHYTETGDGVAILQPRDAHAHAATKYQKSPSSTAEGEPPQHTQNAKNNIDSRPSRGSANPRPTTHPPLPE